MATIVRIRRLHRRPLRIGGTAISNAQVGTLVDLDNASVRRDLQNTDFNRYMIVDDKEHSNLASTVVQPFESLRPDDINTVGALTTTFERFTTVLLPKGTTFTKIDFLLDAISVVPTNMWASICQYNAALTSLTYGAVTNDTTSTVTTVSAFKTFTFAKAYTVPTTGAYAISLMNKADTPALYAGRQVAAGGSALTATGVLAANASSASGTTKTGISDVARGAVSAITAGTTTITVAHAFASPDAVIPYFRLY